MAISISDLLGEVESLLDDEHKQYWEEADKRRYINVALRTCFLWVARANEFLFLEKDSIAVDATAVTNGTLIFTLPDRTFYVSHYLSKRFFSETCRFNFMPRWVPDSGDPVWLSLDVDYLIGLPRLIIPTAYTVTGDIELWVKKMPARVKTNTGTIDVPDVMYDFIMEMVLFYAYRKDGNPEQQTNLVLHRDQCLDILKTQDGFPEVMGYDWENLVDSGDL